MAVRVKGQEAFGGDYGKGSAPVIDIDEELHLIEKELDELRNTYELYFMGIEKLEPAITRDKIKSKLRRYQALPMRSVQKFKFGTLRARMIALETYWMRVTKQKEAGTYRKDVEKAKRREQEREKQEKRLDELKKTRGLNQAEPGSQESDDDISTDGRGLPAPKLDDKKSDSRAQSAAKAQARPMARSADDLNDNTIKQLYETLAKAKKQTGERNDLKIEDMASSLRKQVPKLLKSTGAKAVEFKVVIKDGKAVLKAVPRT
ncbi:MAG: hypothetical protein HY791_33090 [Deltaproteobacteria bacterium]|nr:hypothetical protein [Deltaproteobacteria bacterium]